VQHRAHRRAGGRHRRTEPLHNHRAPHTPLVLGDRGRHAILTATLVAGVGVVSVSAAATASQAQVSAQRASSTAASQAQVAAQHAPSAAPTDAASADATSTGAASTASAGLNATIPPGTGTGTGSGSDAAAVSDADAASSATATELGSVESVVIPPTVPGSGGTLSWIAPIRAAKPAVAESAQWVNPLPEAIVTSCFGERWGRLHAGVDLAAPYGTPIRAAGAGVVVAAGTAAGYGNAVLIDHGNGFLTHYGHMSVIGVRVGQHVAAGEPIGNEGSTGHSTGPHLHFEVHRGAYKNPIEPTRWMHEHGVDIPGCAPLSD